MLNPIAYLKLLLQNWLVLLSYYHLLNHFTREQARSVMVCLTFLPLVFLQLWGAVVLCWKEQQKLQRIQILFSPVQQKTVMVNHWLFICFPFLHQWFSSCCFSLFFPKWSLSLQSPQWTKKIIDLVKFSTQGTSRRDFSVKCQRGFVVSLFAVILHQ